MRSDIIIYLKKYLDYLKNFDQKQSYLLHKIITILLLNKYNKNLFY